MLQRHTEVAAVRNQVRSATGDKKRTRGGVRGDDDLGLGGPSISILAGFPNKVDKLAGSGPF